MSMNRCQRAFRPTMNRLDDRCLLSGLTPAQLDHAYGLDSFHFVASNGQSVRPDGTGETVAVVEAYHDSSLFNDVQAFDTYWHLSAPQLTQWTYPSKPAPSSTLSGWVNEEDMDVELVHALAPGAKIIVVEAASQSTPDLLQAINFARNQPGVVAVSMSFWMSNPSGSNSAQYEFPSETQLDSYFTTPSGHTPITFLAATGDQGAFHGPEYPASSPNVLAVGGTTLSVDSSGNYVGETGWGTSTAAASGGGFSAYETEPSYQYSVQKSGWRTTPDVSMDADPNSGMIFYTVSPTTGQLVAETAGGTSASTPEWAALIAIADQGRALSGKSSLDGPTQTLPAIYSSTMSSDFHDIVKGYNGYYAGTGYDLVTGRGSPLGFNVVRDLMQVVSVSASSVATSQASPHAIGAPGSLPNNTMSSHSVYLAHSSPAQDAVAVHGTSEVSTLGIALPPTQASPIVNQDIHHRRRIHDFALDTLFDDSSL